MDFQYNEEQVLLTDSVRKYVEREYDFETRKRIIRGEGASADVWAKFAEMGLLAIALPAEHGGFGGTAVDLIGVMQAFGEALVVEPYMATVILGAGLIARAGSQDQMAQWLPAVAEGQLKLAFAHGEPDSRYQVSQVSTQAKQTAKGWELSGRKTVVLGAPLADRIIVSARTSGANSDANGIGLFAVERGAPGLTVSRYQTADDQLAGDLTLASVAAVPLGSHTADALAIIEEVLDFATAVSCAEAVGAIEYANAATLEYIKTRKQFGVPIASFQALQHRMVDMTVWAEQSRSMVFLACTSVNGEKSVAERAKVVSAAKVKVSDACRYVSQEAVQLHGGMGMTEELKVSHTFRRLTMLARRFGDADHHLQRFVAAA
jgi:alkylation response protein AidB-like acyl-CoA dehydrogenase